MPVVTARAPAKVNLVLRVGPPRPDGFHEVATIYQSVSLYDDVSVTPAEEFTVTVEGSEAAATPVDGSNLAAKAAQLLATTAGVDDAVAIAIMKSIPVAAGLAGGSADAAATLVACDALWRLNTPRQELVELAAQLGSDVPFALVGGLALGTGRGDRLSPVLGRGSYDWVLAVADGGLSTPEVYARLDTLRAGHDVPAPVADPAAIAALRSGDAAELAAALTNDLEPAALALAPALRAVLRAGEEAGALAGLVSGSGPTCAFLARDSTHALDVAIMLAASGVCRAVKQVHGPVAGTKVLTAAS